MSGALATPALLEAAVDTETALGGRTLVWAPAASLWVDLKAVAGREDPREGQPPGRLERAEAEAREHPAAARGQRLTLTGDPAGPWRVLGVERGQPATGRMRLSLERTL